MLCLFRLSAKISRDLTDNNPYLVDLSDVNRPTNLVEKFSSLYDNEWTYAFDGLQMLSGYEDDVKVIQQLLNILMVVPFKTHHRAGFLALLIRKSRILSWDRKSYPT